MDQENELEGGGVTQELDVMPERVIEDDPNEENRLYKRNVAELQERFIRLRAEGMSYNKIARKLGISRSTLIRWFQKLKYSIHYARLLALDSVAKQYVMGKEHRIRFLGEQYQRILNELASRQDYSTVPTPKLLDMALALGDKIETETELSYISFDDGQQNKTKPDWTETP